MKKVLLLVITGFIASGCASSQVLSPVAPNRVDEVTALLIPYELQSEGASNTELRCQLTLRYNDSVKEFVVSLEKGSSALFLEAPAGSYRLRSLSCGSGQTFDLNSLFPKAFYLKLRTIAVLAPLGVRVSEKHTEVTFRDFSRKETQECIKATFEKLPAVVLRRAVSGYTGHPIQKALATPYRGELHWLVHTLVRGSRDTDEINEAGQRIQACYKTEKVMNPLVLGTWKFSAEYLDGKFSKLIPNPSAQNTLTQSLMQCVEKEVRETKLTHPEKVTVEFEI